MISNIQPHRRFEVWILIFVSFLIIHRCWLNSSFPQMLVVSFITNVAFPCLVILYNSCMLGLVMFKLWGIRGGSGGTESSSGRKEMNKEKRSRLWKDCATLLGLSCVLGLPWGLASTTYISLPGIYVFTILNSLQGQYTWCSYTACIVLSWFLLEEFTTFLFSSQVYLCSFGPWLWLASLDLTGTLQSETLPPRKWWQPVSITDIHT